MLGSKTIVVSAVATTLACLLGVALVGGQSSAKPGVQTKAQTSPQASLQAGLQPAKKAAAAPATAEDKPLMSDVLHPTSQVLRGLPEDEFLDTMGFFAASLSMNCTDCHVDSALTTWAGFAQETPNMKTARQMVTMVRAINQSYFGGQRLVTCYTCHRDTPGPPEVTPSLALQYAEPVDVEPATINRQAADQPPPAKILDDYIAAIGGQQAVEALSSYTATGTYQGFDTERGIMPAYLYVQAPGKRALIVKDLLSDLTTVTDGRHGWVAAVTKPVPLLPLTGGDLDGAKDDAIVALPSQIKGSFTKWRTGNEFNIDGNDVYVVQGMSSGNLAVKFYFDEKTHLLVRMVRYSPTNIGIIPIQVDYSDYHDVAGIKLPFQQIITWTNGRSTLILTDVQPNATIDATVFNRPPAAVANARK